MGKTPKVEKRVPRLPCGLLDEGVLVAGSEAAALGRAAYVVGVSGGGYASKVALPPPGQVAFSLKGVRTPPQQMAFGLEGFRTTLLSSAAMSSVWKLALKLLALMASGPDPPPASGVWPWGVPPTHTEWRLALGGPEP